MFPNERMIWFHTFVFALHAIAWVVFVVYYVLVTLAYTQADETPTLDNIYKYYKHSCVYIWVTIVLNVLLITQAILMAMMLIFFSQWRSTVYDPNLKRQVPMLVFIQN